MTSGPAQVRVALPVCLAYVAYFAAAGIYQPYFPIWLDVQGFDGAQIAIIFSVPMLVRVVFSPLVGWLADKTGRRTDVIRALLIITVVAAIFCSRSTRFAPVLSHLVIMMIAWQGVLPLLEANTLDLVPARRFPTMAVSGCGVKSVS